MKKITLLLLLITIFGYSQKKIERLDNYTASNGITYKEGDEIKLGRGSDTNGNFVYVVVGGWTTTPTPLPSANTGLIVTIKKIKKFNYKRYKGVYFTVGGGNITNYTLDIESAIKTCEIEDCKRDSNLVVVEKDDKFDKLKKLKELFDTGVLSEEEYTKEKNKLLESN